MEHQRQPRSLNGSVASERYGSWQNDDNKPEDRVMGTRRYRLECAATGAMHQDERNSPGVPISQSETV